MPVSLIVGFATVATNTTVPATATVTTRTAHSTITAALHTTTDSPFTTAAFTFPVASPTNISTIIAVATAAPSNSEIAITSTARNSKQPTKRVRHLITSGAFTRQSLPDSGMPKGSTLEIEVGKLEEKWQRERSDILKIVSPIRYQLLLERFKSEKGLLPAIAESSNEDAVKTFAFYPSCLGKLEIRDDRGVLLGYRFHVEKEYLITLSNSDQMLPERRQRKKGGGGDPIARGVFDTRHYTVWADYGNTMRENRELEEDRPASTQWIKSNTGLFHALSHQLRMLEPEAYVHLTKAVKKKMSEYKSSTGESLFPFAGAWHGVCINRGQQRKASSAHQDWMDLPTGFNCVVPYGSGFTGANLILMQLKMQIQLSIGEGFLFRGAIIAHKVSDIESGFRNSIDLFAHKSTFDIVRKANERAKKKNWDKSEGKKRMETVLKKKYSGRKTQRQELRKEKKLRQRKEENEKCLG